MSKDPSANEKGPCGNARLREPALSEAEGFRQTPRGGHHLRPSRETAQPSISC
jgi:hypothetical protein